MAYNISMTSKDQVLALINRDAGLSLTWKQVTFGTPVPVVGPESSHNTELAIQGIHNGGYKNTATVFYNRMDLGDLGTLDDQMILQIEGLPTLEKVLDSLNLLVQSNLQLDDVRADQTVPPDITDGVDFTLQTNDGSYAYTGALVVRLQPADIDIDQAVTDKYLNGLTLTPPPEPTG